MKKIFALIIVVVCLASCRDRQSDAPVVRYRLIGQITAYQEDGGVQYTDFVMSTGIPSVEDGQLVFTRPKASEAIRVSFQHERDDIVFSLQGIETKGAFNSWTRLKTQESDTFGADTECEIWLGTTEPKEK